LPDPTKAPDPDTAPPDRPAQGPDPRVLMLGMGWFPATLGGLNRYYRALFEQLDAARGVVIGPAEDAPREIDVVAGPRASLPRRMLLFRRAALRGRDGAELLDAHFALYAAAPLLLGGLGGLPSVFHFQGPWADENVAAGDSSRLRHRLRATLERLVHARIDAHVVLSSAFRRVLVERYRVAPWNVHVLAPGVDLELFAPGDRTFARERLGLQPGAFAVICTRRLVPRMGLEVLLDAWGELCERLPSGSVLLLVGDGPLRGRLEQRAAAAPLAGRVRVLGRISDGELIDAYRAADVAVVPTVALEGYGLVVLEAAACGTPSIVSDVGGLAEAALGLDPSLVVPGGDAGALAARLEAAAAGGLPARERARDFAERHSWTAVAGRHRALYRSLLADEPDRRTKVVYLDHVARLSGGEIALMRLLPRMKGVNVHVILGEDGPLADRLVKAGVSVEVMAIAPAARDLRRQQVRVGAGALASAWSTAVYVLRLAHRLRRLSPDLVHTNSLKAGVYGSVAARLAGVPVVWHVRDRVAEDYIPATAVRLVRSLVRRLAGGVIANSQATLATLDGYAPAASWVIPASVELSPLPHQGQAHTTFGMLGRIAPWKGQDLFLRAFAQAFPDGPERAVLIGAPMFGEEEYEHSLHRLVDTLGLGDRVLFRGFREDVWPELASLDVLVHASTIPEPFGTVVLEGMAAGLAVIAPDQGGPATVIEDGRTGRLFEIGDQRALAAAMRELGQDPAARERLSGAARQALAAYHPDVIARRLEEVYEGLLGAAAG
jgi:glycosyltransferase involved in cell wall biosynthesis